ncbi:MAG: NADH-quinone oxidoreductase subunit A [Caldilineaceae bacterium]
MNSMAAEYFPLLILLAAAVALAVIAIALPSVLGPSKANKQKLEPYESGMIPYGDARRRFPIKYYLVAMLFLLFDIEVVFTYPWASVLTELRDGWGFTVALAPMGVFLLVLIVGLVYEWRKGAIRWE